MKVVVRQRSTLARRASQPSQAPQAQGRPGTRRWQRSTTRSIAARGDPHRRRPIECLAVRVERRTEHGPIVRSACPGGEAAAVPEARLVADEDLVGAEGVSVGAVRGWVSDPLPGRCLHQLAQHP
jgi:hypothetical protein